MRDLLIVIIVLVAAVAALRRPWIGVLCWTWLSIMNPHRYTWGFAYDAPLAAIAAGSTLLGLLFTRDRESPFKGSPVVWFVLFTVWITVSWLMGLGPEGDYDQWNKVMKINFMILVALALIRSRVQIFSLAWVAVGSLALLGIKGGLFTLATGGANRVWGPPGSFIHDNNEFALAMVMTIPLLRFLQMQCTKTWQRHALTGTMLLCAAAALGSQSRGALLAIVAMTALLWWRGRSRFVGGLLLLSVGVALVAFMPESWVERMSSIENYQEDRSAQGRISAWHVAWNIGKNYVFGVGFNAARADLFARFSPYPEYVHAAHSIYFQVMGNHGFIGLFLFLGIWITTWRQASWLRAQAATDPQLRWCADLGSLCQVALVGYAVGGALLSLAYFDLPYNLMVLLLSTRLWVMRQGWLHEHPGTARRWLPPGAVAPPA